jgi:hypothetical protein
VTVQHVELQSKIKLIKITALTYNENSTFRKEIPALFLQQTENKLNGQIFSGLPIHLPVRTSWAVPRRARF